MNIVKVERMYEYVTVNEAARVLGYSKANTLYKKLIDTNVTVLQVGRVLMVRLSDLR